jgi:PTH1 family peptidyl-tRNA hydrolase
LPGPWLVVGLGNPGPDYAATRHNVGFHVVDLFADQVRVRLARHKQAHAQAAQARLGLPGSTVQVVLAEPMSFMNESGGPVKSLASYYDVPPERLVVVHDELDIPFTAIRVKLGGGDNGHNGLKSIRRALGTGEFYRVRVGIGRPPGRQEAADYVLRAFGSTERKELPEVVQRAADAVESIITSGLEATQNRFNADPA